MRSSLLFLACAAATALPATPAAAQPASPPLPPADAPQTAPWPSPAQTTRGGDSALPWSRIEQVRRGNRVVELRITDSAGETRYTMVNREGQPPLSAQELTSGLSTPRFLRFDF